MLQIRIIVDNYDLFKIGIWWNVSRLWIISQKRLFINNIIWKIQNYERYNNIAHLMTMDTLKNTYIMPEYILTK
jgi:hypothetical protein